MRDYIPKKGKINKDVFMQTKYRLRRYSAIKSEFVNLKNKKSLSRSARKRLKAIEREIVGIELACGEMLARYSCFAKKDFEPIAAYFSYEHYNLNIKRSSNPDDLGPSPKKWAEFKREFTEVLIEKLNIA